jgi:chaperonin cofactor prefoldin
MDDTKLLSKIGELIDTKLDNKLLPIIKKIDALDSKAETLDLKIEAVNKKIDKAQEETIDVLSELIASGYNNHERRIKKIEDHLQIPQIQ